MPWLCCESELRDSLRTCPSCGTTKQAWTVRLQKTRVFQIARKHHWVEFKVLDWNGEALRDEPYVLVLSDGTTRQGRTDSEGNLVHEQRVPAGTCILRLPERDPRDYGLPPPRFQELPPAPPDLEWIEFRLIDWSGDPVAGEPYRLVTADGREREGETDERGRGRQEALPAGTCTLRFPSRVADDFVLVQDEVRLPQGGRRSPAAAPDAWIELALLDADGQPLAEEPYVLLLPGGAERAGTTDARGRAREDALPPGEVTLRLPERTPPCFGLLEGDRVRLPGAPPQAPSPTDEDWVELELLDAAGGPLADEPYELVLPGGAKREGTTDARGKAREAGLPQGSVTLLLKNRTAQDYGLAAPDTVRLPAGAKAEPPAPAHEAWLELQLLDPDGLPLTDEPYTLVLPDGSERQGQTDAAGKARQDGLPEGEVRMRLPARSAADLQPV